MYTFGNVKVGGFFTEGAYTYRKVLHAKCWDHDIANIRYYNAVGIELEAPVMRLFEDGDALENIPRSSRIDKIPLDAIHAEMKDVISNLRQENIKAVTILEEILALTRDEKWEEAHDLCMNLSCVEFDYVPPEMYAEICERYIAASEENELCPLFVSM